MPEVNPCEARQHSDQMVCHKCDLGWDMNDPYPPECGLVRRQREVEEMHRNRRTVSFRRGILYTQRRGD